MRAHNFHRPLAMADRADPELEVLRPIVIADAVLVVHGFASAQSPPQRCLHDDPVLVHSPRTLSNQDVTVSVNPSVSVPVLLVGHGLADQVAPMLLAEG